MKYKTAILCKFITPHQILTTCGMRFISEDWIRPLSLTACFLSSLGCGTMYLFSAYSPQLAMRVGLSATEVSALALVGSAGMAFTGPLAGRAVDKIGYTLPVLFGGLAISSGYGLIRYCYLQQLKSITLLTTSLLLIGGGSTFTNSAGVKCAAVCYPNLRGIATSIPVAAFGLSAFVFSMLGSLVAPNDTPMFFSMLIITIFVLTSLGSIFVGLPLPNNKPSHHPIPTTPTRFNNTMELHSFTPISNSSSDTDQLNEFESINLDYDYEREIDIHGVGLVTTSSFWSYCFIIGLLAGIGQMYIYSCGYIIKALFKSSNSNLDPDSTIYKSLVSSSQRSHVAIISIFSFFGRLTAGFSSDLISNFFKKSRNWLLLIPGFGFLLSQLLATIINNLKYLKILSIIIGFSYGFSFGLLPSLISDSYGMRSFSSNWGIVSLAPVGFAYLFNMLFGKIYDSNTINANKTCDLGISCYKYAFKISFIASIISILFISHHIYQRVKSSNVIRHSP